MIILKINNMSRSEVFSVCLPAGQAEVFRKYIASHPSFNVSGFFQECVQVFIREKGLLSPESEDIGDDHGQ